MSTLTKRLPCRENSEEPYVGPKIAIQRLLTWKPQGAISVNTAVHRTYRNTFREHRALARAKLLNPYAPTNRIDASNTTAVVIKRIARYSMSALVFAAGLGLMAAGASTFADVVTDDQRYATHGPATFEWTLISALLALGGSLWMIAAILYLKGRNRIGHWTVLTGFLSAFFSMFVGIPV